jgi:ubiquinone/menaquinone biosynthesis C-methylase UbiE
MNLISIIQMIINAFQKPRQHINIPEIPTGVLLDIGGGGEGVIAQVGGDRVIAIDKYMSEIREAKGRAPDSQWMVADGSKLPFEIECFDNATSFFSCMYMSEDVKEKVFKETCRVLKRGGEFWIWDVNMKFKNTVFAIRVQADLPENRTTKTVYGVKAKDQDAAKISELLQKSRFEAEVITEKKHWFFIKGRKRDSQFMG